MNKLSKDLSIIIDNWNTCELLSQCLHSIYETIQQLDFETFVVDNASADRSVEMVRRLFPEARLIQNTDNVGFVRANNQAIDRCHGRYVLLLNSDTRVLPGSIEEMVQFMDVHPYAGASGARLLNPDGSFQASYSPFPTLWREFLILSTLGRWLIRPFYPSYGPQTEKGAQKIRGYVEGACIIARHKAIDQIGGLDERIFMYAEEVDWCYRFYLAGWEVWYLPHVEIIHHGGQSTKMRSGIMEAQLYCSRVYFFKKHYGQQLAMLLKMLIYTLTFPKILLNRMLRFLSDGCRGRNVPTLKQLHASMRST